MFVCLSDLLLLLLVFFFVANKNPSFHGVLNDYNAFLIFRCFFFFGSCFTYTCIIQEFVNSRVFHKAEHS